MAYYMKSEGLDQLGKMLQALGDQGEFVASHSLYEGAGAMARAIEASANKIRTAPFKWARSGEYRLPSPEEKAIVTEGSAMGIAKFRKEGGGVNTSVGYNSSGYADVNWNHMSSSARTNYKAFEFKGRENTASSTLAFIRKSGGSTKYGLGKNVGRGAQNRKPIGVIANAINSGTSFMRKQPFFRKGYQSGESMAIQKILDTAEMMLNKIIKEHESGGKTA